MPFEYSLYHVDVKGKNEVRKLIRDQDGLDKLAHSLKRTRQNLRLTQEDVSYAAGISVSQVSRIERGILNPTVSTIFYLARAMKIPVAELFQFPLSPFDN